MNSLCYTPKKPIAKRQLNRAMMVGMMGTMGLLLPGCGGGGSTAALTDTTTTSATTTSNGTTTTTPTATLVPMTDSFGNTVTWSSTTNASDSTAAGADGTAAVGLPLPNAIVLIIDSAGRSISGKTDAQGYYRVRVDGFEPPMMAQVTSADGQIWYAPSVAAVTPRGFITINLTGLTDKLAYDVALAAGKTSAAQLTPALLAANPTALQTAKAALKKLLASQIAAAGLNAATFDPVTLAFKPDFTGYDMLLESVTAAKSANGATTIGFRHSLGGSIVGLASSGLIMANGAQTVMLASNASAFSFATLLSKGAAYNVTVQSQPAGQNCTVSNGKGVMADADVSDVSVVCVLLAPTAAPTTAPTVAPTTAPTTAPTVAPTTAPTTAPTVAPTTAPTTAPTVAPTKAPTTAPTAAPTTAPTAAPTVAPTSGYSLVSNFAKTECVKDNATGLTWEGKTTDGGLRDTNNLYSNFDSTTALQVSSGASFVAPTQAQLDAANNSAGYKAAVNAAKLCGYTDWRVPTIAELQSLIKAGATPTAIDATWFPNTQSSFYWSSSIHAANASDPNATYYVYFAAGTTNSASRNNGIYLRLVR